MIAIQESHLEQLARTRRGQRSPIRGRKFAPEPLTDDEIRKLLKQCSPRASTGIRNRGLILAMFRAGLRVSEALNLEPRDFDAATGNIRVRRGKGGKSRVVAVDPATVQTFAHWLDRRAKLGIGAQCPLFCTLAGRKLQSAYCRNWLRRIGKKAGIEKRVHPHGLRHSAAVSMLRDELSIPEISQTLGHSNISTTCVYLNHVAPEHLLNRLRQRNWEL